MKKYLITGGAGFIGSHIAEHLSNNGHKVTILDSLRTGFEKNLNGLNVNFVNGDIRDEELLKNLAKDADSIFHLAALVSVPETHQADAERHAANAATATSVFICS